MGLRMRTDIVNLAIFEFIMAIVIGGYLSLLLFLLFLLTHLLVIK